MDSNNNFFSELLSLLNERKNGSGTVEWQDITDFINQSLGTTYDRNTVRKGNFLIDLFQRGGYELTPPVEAITNTDDATAAARELQKERMKLQTEKLEYNRWLRENARDELIVEKLSESIRSLPPIIPPARRRERYSNRIGVLCMGDAHFGSQFEIRGLNGEVLNAYNLDIAHGRMWELLDRVIDLCEKEEFDTIHVFDLGDFTDGVLRVGQLMKLECGVVDATVDYMELLAQWLNRLTEHVNVKFQMTGGNHDQLRFFNQPKGAFKDEDMSKIVRAYIKARLSGNPNFEYIENPTGHIFTDVAGFNLLGIHGECKNMGQAIKDFSATYKVPVDILVGGHLHHAASENVGYNVDVVRVPSLIGIDPFSMTLNKTSNAGALFLVVEEGVGLVTQHFVKLN